MSKAIVVFIVADPLLAWRSARVSVVPAHPRADRRVQCDRGDLVGDDGALVAGLHLLRIVHQTLHNLYQVLAAG